MLPKKHVLLVCMFICVLTEARRESDPLELGLQAVVKCLVIDSGNGILVIWKKSKMPLTAEPSLLSCLPHLTEST